MSNTDSIIVKYRPRDFGAVLGHDEKIAAFKDAAKVSRAFIFSGQPGIGKTTLARLCAAHVGTPKNQLLEIDAATCNGVDDMRELTSVFNHRPMLGGSKATRSLIFDECHRISAAGWTTLLKPIEEAPPWVNWFFCTTDVGRVPANIRSRCAVFVLEDVKRDDLVDFLGAVADEEGWDTPKQVISLCAQEALGSPRRALVFLSACHNTKTREEAAKAINVGIVNDKIEGLGYQLALILAGNVTSKWKQIQPLLLKIQQEQEHPESVRQVVRAYFTTVAINAKEENSVCFAAKVLDNFGEAYNTSDGYSPLVTSVCRTIF